MTACGYCFIFEEYYCKRKKKNTKLRKRPTLEKGKKNAQAWESMPDRQLCKNARPTLLKLLQP